MFPPHGEGHVETNTESGKAERQRTCAETSPEPLDPAMPELLRTPRIIGPMTSLIYFMPCKPAFRHLN